MKAKAEFQPDSDRNLVGQACRGDRQAYTEIIARYSRRVHSIIYQVVRNSEDARDIAQEVLVKVYFSLKNYDPKMQFVHWLYRIATNQAIDFLRNKKVARQYVQNSAAIENFQDRSNPETAAINDQMKRIICDVAQELPDHQLQAFILRDLQDLTVAEITEIMQCKASTVRVHLAKARIYIRERLKTDFPEFIPGGEGIKNEL